MSALLTVIFQTSYVQSLKFSNGVTVKYRADGKGTTFSYSANLGFTEAEVSPGWSGTFYWDRYSNGYLAILVNGDIDQGYELNASGIKHAGSTTLWSTILSGGNAVFG